MKMKKAIAILFAIALCFVAIAVTMTACGGDADKTEKPAETHNYVDVFIFMGQSNMSGCGRADTSAIAGGGVQSEILCETGHGYEYRPVTGSDEEGWLYPVEEPFGKTEMAPLYSDSRSGGMVSAFMESYYTASGVPVVGVSASHCGDAISEWLPGTAKLTEAKKRLFDCLTYLKSDQSEFEVRNVGMVWCQGCSDSYKVAHENYDYEAKLQSIFDELKFDSESGEVGVEKCFVVTPSPFSLSNNVQTLIPDKVVMVDYQAAMCERNENFILASKKFSNVPFALQDGPHFFQSVYNVCGWDAGSRASYYFETGNTTPCDVYLTGEASEYAERFGFSMIDNRGNVITEQGL